MSSADEAAVVRGRRSIRWLAFGRLVASTATGFLVFAFPAVAGELVGRVAGVHDGDTLTILVNKRQVRVRLVDIDAPELHQAFGRRSRDSLAGMCAGQEAHVFDQGRDRYKRVLGRVMCGSLIANTEQVQRGMAWVYVHYAPKNSPLYRLESQARMERRGLWSDPHAVPPWNWRHRPKI